MKDVTKEYVGMVEAFECDFSLAQEKDSKYGLDNLQVKIEKGDKRLLGDIDLLSKLSFGLRHGRLRIIETEAASIEK